jgi:kinesin family protein 6/9
LFVVVQTVMIATMSGLRAHVDESISTCRFAARVAMVRNSAVLNEELDPKLLVRKLKVQVRELKEEIAAMRGEKGVERNLDADELERCRQLVNEYVSSANPPPLEAGMPNPRRVEACFAAFKALLLAAQGGEQGVITAVAGSEQQAGVGGDSSSKGTLRLHASVAGGGSSSSSSVGVLAVANSNPADKEELKKLRLLVAARENEISQLVALLRQNVAPGHEVELLQGVRDRAEAKARADTGLNNVAIHSVGALQQSLLHSKGVEQLSALHARTSPEVRGASESEDSAALAARLKAFEEFRRSYRKNQLIEEQKDALKAKIEAAQKLGESINRERNNINAAKARIEQRRLARGVASLQAGEEDPSAAAAAPDAEEQSLLSSIDASKLSYRQAFSGLKESGNTSIRHVHGLGSIVPDTSFAACVCSCAVRCSIVCAVCFVSCQPENRD